MRQCSMANSEVENLLEMIIPMKLIVGCALGICGSNWDEPAVTTQVWA